MVFKSRIDRYYLNFLIIIIAVLALALFFPLFLEGDKSLALIIFLVVTFVISLLFILWSTLSIVYIFNEKYLFVKGGPFRSKIPYEKIMKVTTTHDVLTGYRIMSSKVGLEVFYNTGLLGSVKISPLEQELFVDELVKRCPEIKVEI